MNKPSVYIAYTGGTIGMSQSSAGFKPRPGHLLEAIKKQPEFQSDGLPDIKFHEYDER